MSAESADQITVRRVTYLAEMNLVKDHFIGMTDPIKPRGECQQGDDQQGKLVVPIVTAHRTLRPRNEIRPDMARLFLCRILGGRFLYLSRAALS